MPESESQLTFSAQAAAIRDGQARAIATYPQCDEHRIRAGIPCPFIGCPQGTSADSCVEQWALPFPIEWNRESWNGIDGHPYYSWRRRGSPHFVDAALVVEQELWRRNAVQHDIASRIVYHYATISGLLGIIESHGPWLTHADFLNDPRESAYGKELVARILKATEYGQLVLREFESDTACEKFFVSSGSLQRDKLDLWKIYGDVAVGIEYLNVNNGPVDLILDKVVYDPRVQELIINVLINHDMQAMSRDVAAFGARMESLHVRATSTHLNRYRLSSRQLNIRPRKRFVCSTSSTKKRWGYCRDRSQSLRGSARFTTASLCHIF